VTDKIQGNGTEIAEHNYRIKNIRFANSDQIKGENERHPGKCEDSHQRKEG